MLKVTQSGYELVFRQPDTPISLDCRHGYVITSSDETESRLVQTCNDHHFSEPIPTKGHQWVIREYYDECQLRCYGDHILYDGIFCERCGALIQLACHHWSDKKSVWFVRNKEEWRDEPGCMFEVDKYDCENMVTTVQLAWLRWISPLRPATRP